MSPYPGKTVLFKSGIRKELGPKIYIRPKKLRPIPNPEARRRVKELCTKYGITRLPESLRPENYMLQTPFSRYKWEFDRKLMIGYAIFGLPCPIEVLYPLKYRNATAKENKRYHNFSIPIFNKGEFVDVRINLRAKKEDIEEQIKFILKYFERYIVQSKDRYRTTIDWLIYDRHKYFGKSLRQITREIFNIKDNDKGFDALRKQVERAYKKAQRIIEIITPLHSK